MKGVANITLTMSREDALDYGHIFQMPGVKERPALKNTEADLILPPPGPDRDAALATILQIAPAASAAVL